VVEEALALADADGLEALSMPSLARRLGCGVMTIYGHVRDKEDLLDAIAQRGLRDLRLHEPSRNNAEEILTAWGRALRETLIAHPSLPMIFLSRAVIGPGIFRGVEALLERLEHAGMAPAVGVHAVYAVLVHTTGFVAWEIPRTHRQAPEEYASAWRREFAALPPAALPLTAGVLDRLPEVAGSTQFEFGLRALTRGLARTKTPPPVPTLTQARQ
jgi:AcrR family transcriptional regulator